MAFFYQIFISLFGVSVRIASLFSRKAGLFVRGRRTVFEDLANCQLPVARPDEPFGRANSRVVWFHCASLGEFEQARPLIERVKKDKSKVLITFFSPSGYEIRKNYEGADIVCYLPVDLRSNVKKFLDIVKPSQVFFVKYDLWYNYLNELYKRKIPVYLVSANFREEQFNGIYGSYVKRVLLFFKHIFVQNENSLSLLAGKNISNVSVSGDLRYDRAAETALKPRKISTIEHFKAGRKIFIAGSSWEKDEQIIADCRLQVGDCKLIIAPHEINERHTEKIRTLFPDSLLYSEVSKETATTALDKLEAAQVLIIDNIGMLSNLYQYADIAYIGGGFGTGIHNILEAVAFGVPVIFGPNHQKFPEAAELIEQGGGFGISDQEDFQNTMKLLLSDEMVLKMASMTCKNFVQGRKGATERILKEVLRF